MTNVAKKEKGEDRSEGSSISLLGVAVALCAVSTSAVLIRWSEAPPLSIAFYRLLFTLFLLAPFALTSMREDLKKNPLSRQDLGKLVSIGIVLSFHFALWITSLTMTTVASSVLLVTFHPVIVGILGFYLLGERLSKVNVLGIGVAFIGTFVLLWGDLSLGFEEPFSETAIIGDILAFLGGIMAGLYILGGRYFRQTMSLITYVFIVYSACTVSLLMMCIASGLPFWFPPKEFLLFLAMAIGPGILGHTLYNWSLKYVKATVISVSLLGEPVGSTILAYFLLFETPTSLTVLGGIAILVGIYLAATGLRGKD